MIETQFINYLIKSGDADLIVKNRIDSSFFSEYREEFNFILEHLRKYQQIPDQFTFLNQFRNFDVIEVAESTQYLVDELYKSKSTRMLAENYTKIREDILNSDIDSAKSAVMNLATDLAHSSSSLNAVDIIHETDARFNTYVEKSTNFDSYYVSTGLRELDEILGGGWNLKEELATIVARPGIGKSWSLLKFAAAAVRRGFTVGYYSGEMTDTSVGYRFDSLDGGISNKDISHGNIEVQNNYKQYLDSLHDCVGKLYVLTPQMIGKSAGVSDLRAFIEIYKLDILFIDQHSLLDDDRHARDPIVRASNISKDLKELQTLTQVGIISASQQNRERTEAEDGTSRIDLTHISQSDRIGQDSTFVLFLEKPEEDTIKFTVAKSRNGVSGQTLRYTVNLNNGIFTYLPNNTSSRVDEEQRENLYNTYENPNHSDNSGFNASDDGYGI